MVSLLTHICVTRASMSWMIYLVHEEWMQTISKIVLDCSCICFLCALNIKYAGPTLHERDHLSVGTHGHHDGVSNRWQLDCLFNSTSGLAAPGTKLKLHIACRCVGIHKCPVVPTQKRGAAMRKTFPCYDVVMKSQSKTPDIAVWDGQKRERHSTPKSITMH